MKHLPDPVRQHLTAWFGGWNSADHGIAVVESEHRRQPGWDGNILSVVGLAHGDWAVLSVAPGKAEAVEAQIGRGNPSEIATVLTLMTAAFRWRLDSPNSPDAGQWVPTADDRVPAWLKPFNGDVLIEWDDHGRYGAGVGRKMHNALGHEISVGTEPALQGRGIAQRLVETATRRILREAPLATYIHLLENVASGKVAERAGFADNGWRYLGTPEI